MSTHRLLRQDVKRTTLDSAVCPCKASSNNFVLKTQCLKNLCSFVACERANAHLRHHLEHALRNRLAIERDDLVVVEPFEQSISG